MSATTPEDLLNRAKVCLLMNKKYCLVNFIFHYIYILDIFFLLKEIVWRHKELQANVNSLQQQVSSAEQDQERLVRQRQHEILSKYRKNGHVNGVSDLPDFLFRN